MSYTASMTIQTAADLSALLSKLNAVDLARESGLALKTIYRYRWGTSSPTLASLERLMPAVKRLQAAAVAKSARKPKQAATRKRDTSQAAATSIR